MLRLGRCQRLPASGNVWRRLPGTTLASLASGCPLASAPCRATASPQGHPSIVPTAASLRLYAVVADSWHAVPGCIREPEHLLASREKEKDNTRATTGRPQVTLAHNGILALELMRYYIVRIQRSVMSILVQCFQDFLAIRDECQSETTSNSKDKRSTWRSDDPTILHHGRPAIDWIPVESLYGGAENVHTTGDS